MAEEIEGFVGTSFMRQVQRDAILAVIPAQGVFIELGTGHGATVAWWAKQRPGVTFMSIDTFQAAEGTGPGDIAHWLENRQPNQHLFVGTSWEFCELFVSSPTFDKCVEVVFIDGGHSYKDTLIDLQELSCRLEYDGLLLVHDYGRVECAELRGVTRAVDDFCAQSDWQKVDVLVRTALLKRNVGC